MSKFNKRMNVILAVLVLAALACNLPTSQNGNPQPTSPGDAVGTSVAATLSVGQTQAAIDSTSVAATLTMGQTQTALQATSFAATQAPTATPKPTNTPQPTPVQVACNQAQFIADVSVPDGAKFFKGSSFTKVWRLRNIGSCTWTSEYTLFFVNGDKMGASTIVNLPHSVKPGEYVDANVNLTAPDQAGKYLGNWMLRSNSGQTFGLGGNSDVPFWVQIEVINAKEIGVYDFSANFCDAEWNNSWADMYCASSNFYGEGFVRLLNAPKFETGYEDDEPTLWVYVPGVKGEFVAGEYPAFTVLNGDTFKARIGCLYGNNGCNVNFRLDYRIKGKSAMHTFAEWSQKYDNSVQLVEIDLTPLAGNEIEFILVVQTKNNNSDHHAFWLRPHIARPAP